MELRDAYDKNLNRIEGGCSRPRRADAHGEWGAFNEPHTKIYQRTERINAAIKKVFVFFEISGTFARAHALYKQKGS